MRKRESDKSVQREREGERESARASERENGEGVWKCVSVHSDR